MLVNLIGSVKGSLGDVLFIVFNFFNGVVFIYYFKEGLKMVKQERRVVESKSFKEIGIMEFFSWEILCVEDIVEVFFVLLII